MRETTKDRYKIPLVNSFAANDWKGRVSENIGGVPGGYSIGAMQKD